MLLVSATAVSCTGVTAPAVVPRAPARQVQRIPPTYATAGWGRRGVPRDRVGSGGPSRPCRPTRPVLITEGRVQPSGPELALQGGGGLLESARVGAGREVLPAAVADDEADVGPPPRRDLLVGDAERRVQDRAGRDAGEDALALHQLTGAMDGVLGPHGEAGVQQRGIVELGDEPLVDVAQPVDQLAVARLGGDDLDIGLVLPEVAGAPHQGARGAQAGDEVR